MTPPHLHATAAAYSLRDALARLIKLAEDEAAAILAELLEPAAVLHSPAWGRRHALGGHGDPTPRTVATTDRPARVNRWAQLAERAERRITGVAVMLRLDGPDALGQILGAIPRLQPGTAAVVARHLADEDRWIREGIGASQDQKPLADVGCPVCGHRDLHVQTAGPIDAWTVVCLSTHCHLCTGQGCRCGMTGAVEGVVHIWPRTEVLAGVVAGDAPTTTA